MYQGSDRAKFVKLFTPSARYRCVEYIPQGVALGYVALLGFQPVVLWGISRFEKVFFSKNVQTILPIMNDVLAKVQTALWPAGNVSEKIQTEFLSARNVFDKIQTVLSPKGILIDERILEFSQKKILIDARGLELSRTEVFSVDLQ